MAHGAFQIFYGGCADPAVRVDGIVNDDATYGLFCVAQLGTSADYPIAPVCLPGLRDDLVYRVVPFGRMMWYSDSDVDRPAPQWWNNQGAQLPGRVLRTWGIRSKHVFPGNAVLIEVCSTSLENNS
ncbi:Uncharacterised protein [Arcanobacterium haemolyticum]|nr:Uncharacterised protein [Arcanobacterium haemolyticum]SQH28434.1 Uncharacterised protein [Arcanobacterium haemolyticum]